MPPEACAQPVATSAPARKRRADPSGRRAAPRRVYDSIVDAVGDTPLVRLQRVVADYPGEVFAKIEFMNPMGSIKDRVARHLVRVAAADGRLRPGETVVEASSGNTALGLGMMAALEGYRCKVAVRDRTSPEKLRALRALGVEAVLVDSELPPEHPESYNQVMQRIVAETPGCYFPDQHNNRENNEAHYLSTGPEIWEQMEGRIDYLVAGLGTGGTISGVARYLKEQDPSIRVVGVDVEGSVFTRYFRSGEVGPSAPYLLEGLGDEFPIECVEFDLIDDMVQVSDREAFLHARELARREAIFAGGSSGAALWGVRQVLSRLGGEPARIVTIFPDHGSRYLSTIYSDEWMRRHGFLDA
ncbi:MAG: cysteine synthase family protein [Planctomycetota bacterium]|nr:MAG: cysteine synthase family protein [Planctomycetota bacterium]